MAVECIQSCRPVNKNASTEKCEARASVPVLREDAKSSSYSWRFAAPRHPNRQAGRSQLEFITAGAALVLASALSLPLSSTLAGGRRSVPRHTNQITILMKRILLALLLVGTTAVVKADDASFLQLSLAPEIALRSRETTINGISLNIWGENPQHGVALGFVNGSTGESSGLSLGLVNYSETYRGVAWGFVNVSTEHFAGWQSGCVNFGKEVHGLQWGLVNYAETLSGVQLGLVCIANNNPWFKEFPDKLATGFVFVNWSF